MSRSFAKQADSSMVEKTAFGNEFWTEMVPSNVLSNRDPVLANNFPVPAVQKAVIGDELVNSFEWRYFSRSVAYPL